MPFIRRAYSDWRLWVCLYVIATIVLAYLSLVRAPTVTIGLDMQNRTVHFIAYSIYGAVAAMWRVSAKPGRMKWRRFAEEFLLAAAYGTLLEWLQMYMPLRDADLIDGLCNILGAFAGAALVSFGIAQRLGKIGGSESR